MSNTHQPLIRLFLRPDILAHCQPASDATGGRLSYGGIRIHLEEDSRRPYYQVSQEDLPLAEIVPPALLDEVTSVAWQTTLAPHTPLKPGSYIDGDAVASIRPPADHDDRPRLFVFGPLEAAYGLRHLLETQPERFPLPHEPWTDDDAPLALLDGSGGPEAAGATDGIHYKCPSCSTVHRMGPEAPNPARRRCRACGNPYVVNLTRMRAALQKSAPATAPALTAVPGTTGIFLAQRHSNKDPARTAGAATNPENDVQGQATRGRSVRFPGGRRIEARTPFRTTSHMHS